jgi:RNA polymerase sigma-70 factor, ECF subfamily
MSSTPPGEDHLLVQGLRAGRRDAFARLYGEYHPAIYNLCARIVCDREEAKDLTQEVFVKALGQLPSHDEELKLRPWLYRVATNACYDHLRARKHLDGGDGSVLENTPSRIDEFERSDTVALVEGTLGQLNERYRTALVLKDLHGMPSDEIAAVMEISPSTADVLVHRARGSFKRAFAKLAGDVPAPASLGLVLAPLAVPAALHIVPPLPHVAVPPPSHATVHPLHPAHPLDGSGGGLLAKLATAAGSKVAIAAAAATLIAGGAAVRQVRSAHRHSTPAVAAAVVRPAAGVHSSAGSGWRSWWNRNCWLYGSSWDGRAWPMGDRRSWSNWSGSTWAAGSSSSQGASRSSRSGSWSSSGSGLSGSRQMRSGSSGSSSGGDNWSGGSGGSSNWGGSSGSGSWGGGSSGGSGW